MPHKFEKIGRNQNFSHTDRELFKKKFFLCTKHAQDKVPESRSIKMDLRR